MKKLINGILEFRRTTRPSYAETFAHLALGQSPDALFVACSDSRVVPNVFVSSDPGDLFVIRNVGNMIPRANGSGRSESDESEAAAIEFALTALNVKDIIVCGHSECGAMKAALGGGKAEGAPHLESWLRQATGALDRLRYAGPLDPAYAPHDQLSQLSVLQQLEHCLTYPLLRERVEAGQLALHGWWFDIRAAEVLSYDTTERRFIPINEENAEKLLSRVRG